MLTSTGPKVVAATNQTLRHTHPYITDPEIRVAYAHELIAHYRVAKRDKVDLHGDYWAGILWGFESMAWSLQRRRNQHANQKLG
ncbi:MAG: hypothetical protein AB1649_23160 [Chloroflexota bacterium]